MECVGSFVKQHKGRLFYFKKYISNGKLFFVAEDEKYEDGIAYNWVHCTLLFSSKMELLLNDYYFKDYDQINQNYGFIQKMINTGEIDLIIEKADLFKSMIDYDFKGFCAGGEDWIDEEYQETEVDYETGDTMVRTNIYRKIINKVIDGFHFSKHDGFRFENSYSHLDYDEEENRMIWGPFESKDAA